MAFRSNFNRSAERGETTVLVKNYLAKYVVSVQTDVSDQVWVQFRCIPKCLFGFCYIPPSDSEYYSHEKNKTSEGEDICVIGDLNARFGVVIRKLLNHVTGPIGETLSYPVVPDNIRLPRENAFILSNML